MNTSKLRIRLIQARKKMGLNQQNIADMLNTTTQTYSDIENGKTKNINPLHKKILMEKMELTEEELDEMEIPRVINQTGTNVIGNSSSLHTIDKDLIALLKEEQRKNGELQLRVLDIAHAATEQNKTLTMLLQKYTESLANN